MNTLDAIAARRSIRKFKSDPVPAPRPRNPFDEIVRWL
jgi:nitroreductase